MKLQATDIRRVISAVELLAGDPYPIGTKKLKGSEHTFRIRTGRYRIIYSVWASTPTIEVIKIGQRKEVYRALT